jgi:Enoyl-CoA hydratase/isomerase
MLMTTETVSYANRLSETPLPAWPRRMMQQVDTSYDPNLRTLWKYMKPIGIPCFNQNMLEELHYIFTELQTYQGHIVDGDAWVPVDFSVIASHRSGVFNLGGDLMLFLNLIREKDREGLLNYAMYCIDSLYTRIIGHDASTVTISLVQGDALGGGFELALASDLIIAEAGTRLGLPEILFNLFPGMGAYSVSALEKQKPCCSVATSILRNNLQTWVWSTLSLLRVKVNAPSKNGSGNISTISMECGQSMSVVETYGRSRIRNSPTSQ